jgi:hypothetical protein
MGMVELALIGKLKKTKANLASPTFSGKVIVQHGSDNGIAFPNDAYGGGGDTAGITLISNGGESTALTLKVTNDADDTINLITPSTTGLKHNGYTVWDSNNDGSGSGLDADKLDGLDLCTGRNNEANKVVRTDGSGYLQTGWINTPSGTAGTINKIYCSQDDYIRYLTPSSFRAQLTDGVYQKQNDEIIVDITSPNVTEGSWSANTSTDWGTPRIGTYGAQYTNNGYRQWVIPDGMDTCYISHLTWDSGGYIDVHGVQGDGGLVFLRRINTHQVVESGGEGGAAAVDGGNPNQYDGATVTLAGTGLSTFNSIRFTIKSGRFHFTGMSFSSNRLVGSEGTGMVNWGQLTQVPSLAPTASPTFTGTVSGISKSMVGLSNVDNTSDANKPVSTAQATAIGLKANLASPTFTGTVQGISKSMVGLSNVNNTSDADKPVSTAQATAIGLKANQSTTYTKTEVDNLISPLAKYYAQEAAPTSVNPGDIWFNQMNGKTYIRQIDINDTEIWIDLNGGSTNIFLPALKESDLIQVTDINTNTYNFDYSTRFIQVFVNRLKLRKSEFTAINGSSITLNISLELNDEIEFITLEVV